MLKPALSGTAILLSALSGSPVAAAQESGALHEVADGLYRYTAGHYHSMVWVTDEGIAVLDTLNPEAAAGLKDQLGARFDQPVRYVIYSHNHYDHSYGGEVFDVPGTEFVAHEMAYQAMARSKAETVLPETTFTDQMMIRMGGETLELRYHGPNNGYGSVSMRFPQQEVLFVVDWIVVGRMPYQSLEGYDIEGMITSTEDVLALDWKTFVGGHAEIGTRADVERYLSYIKALYEAVREGMLAGESLETLQEEIQLDSYGDLANYDDWRAANIAGVYRLLADRNYMLKRPEVAETQP